MKEWAAAQVGLKVLPAAVDYQVQGRGPSVVHRAVACACAAWAGHGMGCLDPAGAESAVKGADS